MNFSFVVPFSSSLSILSDSLNAVPALPSQTYSSTISLETLPSLLTAMARSVVLPTRSWIGPSYSFDSVVGAVPSIV